MIEILKSFYNYLSPYLNVVFIACIGHIFFLKKILLQRNAERIAQINQQRDLLYKEIFDKTIEKIENVYEILGDVKKYSYLFQSYKESEIDLLKIYREGFYKYSENLENKLFLVALVLERYEFLIHYKKERKKILSLSIRFCEISLAINKMVYLIIERKKIEEDEFKSELNNLSKICSEINLQLSHTAEEVKDILKNLFNSLDKTECLFKPGINNSIWKLVKKHQVFCKKLFRKKDEFIAPNLK